MSTTNNDVETISIIMIGDTSVGKSTLMKKFITGNFSDSLNPTLGVELYKKEFNIRGKSYLYRIWDTCGQERFRSLSKSYFHSANGIMLLFNLNSIESFENLYLWLNSIKENQSEEIPLVMVGTKCDLECKVSREEIQKYVNENSIIQKFFECSAKDNIGVQEPFIELADLIINLNKEKSMNKNKIKIVKKMSMKKKKSKRKCC